MRRTKSKIPPGSLVVFKIDTAGFHRPSNPDLTFHRIGAGVMALTLSSDKYGTIVLLPDSSTVWVYTASVEPVAGTTQQNS